MMAVHHLQMAKLNQVQNLLWKNVLKFLIASLTFQTTANIVILLMSKKVLKVDNMVWVVIEMSVVAMQSIMVLFKMFEHACHV
jgi:hypothetical protein